MLLSGKTPCEITSNRIVVFSTNSENILCLLQKHISATELKSYKFFLDKDMLISKTFDNQLKLKASSLVLLIFMSNSLTFLRW